MQTFDRVSIKQEAKNILSRNMGACIGMVLAITIAELVLTFVSAGILVAIMNGVISVTGACFFLYSWREQNITISDAVSNTFDQNFLRKLGGMLWMELKIFLWSLMFVIPGIIKAFAYAQTRYILAEFPNVPAMEACEISERMMRGHKTDYFVLQLSFLGWALLSAFSGGILYVLYAGPYMELTYAGVYEEVKQIALDTGVVTMEELTERRFG